MKTVAIIEDQTAIREMLSQAILNDETYEVIIESGDGLAGCEQCIQQKPDFVILDVMLPNLNGTEVLRRFFGAEALPDFRIMISVSALALFGNALSLYLLQRSDNQEAHMQASMIFTSNDVIINIGVILAGALVFWTNSRIPDLIIGSIVFVIVMRGAQRILKLAQ